MADYERLDFAINTALVEALEALDVAFEQYEALEDNPHTRIEISGYGADVLDDLSVALHRNYRAALGYGFEQPGLRTASGLVQTAADALREDAAGAQDSDAYLAELCHDLLTSKMTPTSAAELMSIARACRSPTGAPELEHGPGSEALE